MSDVQALPVYLVREVHNYGGFFGGDTVSLTASPLAHPTTLLDLTIADNVFDNLTDRHAVVAGLALGLDLDGAEVRRAIIVGARDRAILRAALRRPAPEPTQQPMRALAYHCPSCDLWIAGAPAGDGPYTCWVCGNQVG